MANPKHGTTTPDTVLTITLDKRYRTFEVVSVDGAAVVYFTTDGSAPVIGADGSQVLPAAICAVELPNRTGEIPVLKFISAAAVKVSARGI